MEIKKIDDYEICKEKEIKKLGEISLAANELCRVINWASEDAGYKENEFAPILEYNAMGQIERIIIFNSRFGTIYEAIVNKGENENKLLAIYYDVDAERFAVQFRYYQQTDFVFDAYCCEKLKELLLVMESSLQKEVKEDEKQKI